MKAPVHQARPRLAANFAPRLLLVVLCLLASSPASSGGLLWRVSGGAVPGYLLGSLHFGADDMYPLHPRIEQAMDLAERVMVEVNLLELDPLQLAAAVVARGAQPSGQRLADQLPQPLWQALSRLSRRLGMPEATFARQQPWLAALTVSSLSVGELGLDERRGVDRHVMQRAQGKLPVLELESFDAQLRLLSELPLAQQVEMLESAVLDYDQGQELVQGIVRAWRAGDGEGLARLVAEDAASGGLAATGLKARLLDQRNRDMTARIVEQLERPGALFVVVGAAHLVGSDSIVERLVERGYSVTQVPTAPDH